MNNIQARVESFKASGGWKLPSYYAANPVRLAQVGFYFQPVPEARDRCVCFCCGTAVARWKQNSDPRTEHLRYCPNCPFLTGAYQKFRFESKRLESFGQRWPLSREYCAQPWRLAKAGFYYHPRPNAKDRVVCFCCGIALVHWEKPDDPWREHQKHSHGCAFVRGYPTDNIQLPGVATLSGSSSQPSVSKNKSDIDKFMDQLEDLDIPYEICVPSFFTCPITQDMMRDPVVTEDGHTYEKTAIIQWLSSHNSSPMTNKKLHTKLLFPNHNLKSMLTEFAQQILAVYNQFVQYAQNIQLPQSEKKDALKRVLSSLNPENHQVLAKVLTGTNSVQQSPTASSSSSLDTSKLLSEKDLLLTLKQKIVSLKAQIAETQSNLDQLKSSGESSDQASTTVSNQNDLTTKLETLNNQLKTSEEQYKQQKETHQHTLSAFLTQEIDKRVKVEHEQIITRAKQAAQQELEQLQNNAKQEFEEFNQHLKQEQMKQEQTISQIRLAAEQEIEHQRNKFLAEKSAILTEVEAAKKTLRSLKKQIRQANKELPAASSSSSTKSEQPTSEQSKTSEKSSSEKPLERKGSFAKFFGWGSS